MLNALVNGIVDAIDTEFGNGYPVFKKEVEQALVEPCFSVRIVNPTIQLIVGNRYLRKNLVAVHYFPQNYGDYEEINGVFERLFSILEYIKVSGKTTRGTNPDPRVEDGVGIFLIHYDFFVYKTEVDGDTMEQLTIEDVKVKE